MAAEPLDEAQEPEEHTGSAATPNEVPEAQPDLSTPTAPAQSATDRARAEDCTSSDAAAIEPSPEAAEDPDVADPEDDTAVGAPVGRELWEEDWRELEPAELAGLLAGTDPGTLDDWSTLEYLQAVRKHESWTHSRRTRALHRMAVLRPATGTDAGAPDGISRHAAQELAPILAVPRRQAAADLADAHQLGTHLPATLAALDRGAIDLPRAAAIARKGADLPPETLAEYENTVLPGAGTITLESVHARTRTARDQLHPVSLETRHRAAMERRTVQYLPQDDGMAELFIRTSADKALLAYNLMQAHARKLQNAEETRTLGQLRADVFTDMLLRYPDHAYQPTTPDNRTATVGSNTSTTADGTTGATTLEAGPTTEHDTHADTTTSGTATGKTTAQDTDAREPTAQDGATGHAAAEDPATEYGASGNGASGSGAASQGPCTCSGGNTTASVAVTVPLSTLLGLAEDPGELTGYGLIPPEMTRNLTALAKSWLTVLTDDFGHAVAAAKDLRIPPEWLKRLIRLRDRHCRDFGCTVPADQCEIDHTIAWEDGGKTVPENLSARCKPDHKTKHHGAGSITQDHDGTLHYTTRSGHTHTTTPDENWAITYPTADQPHNTTNPRTTTTGASTDGDDGDQCDEAAPPF